jgi:two-component system, chemotaxis family, chemotaxis protein CheY
MLEQTTLLESDNKALAVAAAAPQIVPRLLVIDDDKLHCMIICRIAARAGYTPVGAATYEEAARLTQETAFDCITLDLSLGSHAGTDMLHHLRVIGCKAPIVVISGCDEETCADTVRLARSLNLNVCQSMSKPVDLAVLRYWFERLRGERIAA